jgi:hypothetical protein
MFTIYSGSGAGGFSLLGPALSEEKSRALKLNIERVLRARGHMLAADTLATYPFRFQDGTNDFNDEFTVLITVLPLKRYEELRKLADHAKNRREFGMIADVARELGIYVRFIATELELANATITSSDEKALSRGEVQKVVNTYIGVEGGYLGDFSYRSHADFYVELDLDINPYEYDGTTRERFIKILSESSPEIQARILEGVLQRFPVGSSPLRTQQRADTRWPDGFVGSRPGEGFRHPHRTSAARSWIARLLTPRISSRPLVR